MVGNALRAEVPVTFTTYDRRQIRFRSERCTVIFNRNPDFTVIGPRQLLSSGALVDRYM